MRRSRCIVREAAVESHSAEEDWTMQQQHGKKEQVWE